MIDPSSAAPGAAIVLCVRKAGLLDGLSLGDAARLRQTSRALRDEVDAIAPLRSLASTRPPGHLPWSSAQAAVGQMAAKGYPPGLALRMLERVKPTDMPPNFEAMADVLVWPDSADHWRASLTDCPSLTSLPPCLTRASVLSELSLRRLPALVELPDNLDGLANLETLTIEGVPALRALPASLGALSRLRRLRLMAPGLVTLPNEVSALRALTSLRCDAPELRQLPDGIGQLARLRTLQLAAPRLRELPTTLAGLIALDCMLLACGQLRCLPNALATLPALQVLALHGCVSLAALPVGLAEARAGRPMDIWISAEAPPIADDSWPENVRIGRTTCKDFW